MDYHVFILMQDIKNPHLTFMVSADVNSPQGNTITSAEVYIQSEDFGSGWSSMTYDSGDGEWQLVVDANPYDQGDYTAWVKTTDDQGLETIEYHDFRIWNDKPEITPISPIDSDEISNLYGLNCEISVLDPDGDLIHNAEMNIYNDDTDITVMDWTTMDRIGFTDNFELPG